MRTAFIFKCLDLIFQLAGFFVTYALKDPLSAWVVFGGTQIASTLLNKILLPKQCRATSRIGYELFAVIFCFCGIITLATGHMESGNPFIYFVMASCTVSPVLAIWYLGMTIIEIIKASETNEDNENDILY